MEGLLRVSNVYFRYFSKYVTSRTKIIETHCLCDERRLREGLRKSRRGTKSVALSPAETREEPIISGSASDQRTISDQDVLTREPGHDVAIHAET